MREVTFVVQYVAKYWKYWSSVMPTVIAEKAGRLEMMQSTDFRLTNKQFGYQTVCCITKLINKKFIPKDVKCVCRLYLGSNRKNYIAFPNKEVREITL